MPLPVLKKDEEGSYLSLICIYKVKLRNNFCGLQATNYCEFYLVNSCKKALLF